MVSFHILAVKLYSKSLMFVALSARCKKFLSVFLFWRLWLIPFLKISITHMNNHCRIYWSTWVDDGLYIYHILWFPHSILLPPTSQFLSIFILHWCYSLDNCILYEGCLKSNFTRFRTRSKISAKILKKHSSYHNSVSIYVCHNSIHFHLTFSRTRELMDFISPFEKSPSPPYNHLTAHNVVTNHRHQLFVNVSSAVETFRSIRKHMTTWASHLDVRESSQK